MRRLMSGAVILAAAFALGPFQVAAQQGQRGGRGGPPQQAPGCMTRAGGRMMGAGAGIEGIMRMRERLKLTDSQFQQLDAIRSEVVQRRVRHQARMEELRSRMLAGEVTRGALVDSVTAWREGAAAMRQAQRDRVQSVLTDAQKDTLQTLVQRRRAFSAGRASAMRGMGRHMRMGRGGSMPGRAQGLRGARGWGGQEGMMPGRMRGPRGGGRMGGGGFGPQQVLPDSGSAGGGGS